MMSGHVKGSIVMFCILHWKLKFMRDTYVLVGDKNRRFKQHVAHDEVLFILHLFVGQQGVNESNVAVWDSGSLLFFLSQFGFKLPAKDFNDAFNITLSFFVLCSNLIVLIPPLKKKKKKQGQKFQV